MDENGPKVKGDGTGTSEEASGVGSGFDGNSAIRAPSSLATASLESSSGNGSNARYSACYLARGFSFFIIRVSLIRVLVDRVGGTRCPAPEGFQPG